MKPTRHSLEKRLQAIEAKARPKEAGPVLRVFLADAKGGREEIFYLGGGAAQADRLKED